MWTNSFRHKLTQFDQFDFEKNLDCDLDYTIELTDANGGDSVTGVSNSKIMFSMKSNDCNFQIEGDTTQGEWVFFLIFTKKNKYFIIFYSLFYFF